MAEEQKRKLEIPWATLLPILAALAGIVAQYKPLVSVRPAVTNQKTVGVLADQDVNARLWQDPLSTAQQEREALEAALPKQTALDRLARHSTGALAERIKKNVCERGKGPGLVLAVMLDSGPYLEQTESRLRARQAVLEGLSESGYVPVDGEHIGFIVESPWPLVPPLPCPPSPAPPRSADTLLIPWEECRKAADSDSSAAQETAAAAFDSVIILWLPAASFNPNPLGNFAGLLARLAGNHPEDRANFAVKLIGPANSTGLQAMLRETVEWSQNKVPERDRALDGVQIYCARATASDKELLQQAGLWKEGEPAPKVPLEDQIEGSVVKGPRDGLGFIRTILPDDELLQALIEELGVRGVHAGPWQNKEGGHDGDHIAVISEWDSTYGRGLAKTFEDEVLPEKTIQCGQQKDCDHQIDFFRYMHGIDGRLPGDPKETKSDDQKSSALNTEGEATEGVNQADYLRRLARRLKENETHQWLAGRNPLRAIGILGNDIYDKLMILRALRPEFPDAIFFTNNYDARFELREEWDEAHNLILASPFTGSFLVAQKSRVAPFRDSNQTSMYATTLLAMGKIDESLVTPSPSIFEIGRTGAEQLIRQTDAPSPGLQNAAKSGRGAFTEWIAGPRVILSVLLIVLSLLAMAAVIALGTVDRRKPGGGGRLDRFKRAGLNTYVWLIAGAALALILVLAIWKSGDGNLEPLLFLSGISVWPSEMLRLLGLILAIHFMVKAGFDLRANAETLTPRYHLTELPKKKPISMQIKLGLRGWKKQHGEWLESGARFSAQELWTAYLWRNTAVARAVRVVGLSVIYFAFAYGVWKLFPEPLTPARGHTAMIADTVILRLSVTGLILLMFYVVDSLQQNSNFIRLVTGGVTKWEPQLSISGRIPPLTADELARYHDIKFIEERTEVVTPLIWYPLIVLALMFVARSAYFDNWAWPRSLILIFTLNALWAFGAAAYLRRAAEHLRAEAIRKLQAFRIASYKNSDRRQMFDELIDEIRALKKGAFAPLTEQPFIRAIILPSGGLGLLAVAERVLDVF